MILFLIFQFVCMITDLLLMTALAYILLQGHWMLFLILLFFTHKAMQSVGGWFYAWKPSSIKAFYKRMKEI